MLGVVFTGGQAPNAAVIIKTLENKAAFIVAADSGLAAAEEAGIKPHLIIGDMDSVDNARLSAYPPEYIIRHDSEKDYTDTELAMQAAIEKGCDEIWIIGGGGGRIDHLFGLRSLFERDIFPCRWITKDADIYCIDAMNNAQCTTRPEKIEDRLVSVFPLGGGPWEAKSAGLKWPLEGLPWDRGFFGISNVATDGSFSITAEKGRFMIILTGDTN